MRYLGPIHHPSRASTVYGHVAGADCEQCGKGGHPTRDDPPGVTRQHTEYTGDPLIREPSPMRTRRYYSQRAGSPPLAQLALPVFGKLVVMAYKRLIEKGHFQEAFGYECVDAGQVPGILGCDVGAALFLAIRKDGLWPLTEATPWRTEEDVFDVVEFLFDHVSAPVERKGDYHSYADCGWHYTEFDRDSGRDGFLALLNPVLADAGSGFELTDAGEIVALSPLGLDQLIDQPIPDNVEAQSKARIEAAIAKFRRRSATDGEKRDAVRDLADVLEFVRQGAKATLSSDDEAALFNIANNFGVRHHNAKQKTQYEAGLWLPWMFYTNLATLHVVLRLIARNGRLAKTSNSA